MMSPEQTTSRASTSTSVVNKTVLHVLGALLLLLTAAVQTATATDFVVTGDTLHTRASYDGYTYDLSGLHSSQLPMITVRVDQARVSGGGMTIAGNSAKPPPFGPRLLFAMTEVQVDDASITVSGIMPRYTTIRAVAVQARMTRAIPLFDLAGLQLQGNSTFSVQQAVVSWSGASSGAVVQLTGSSTTNGVFDYSGMYLTGVRATGAYALLSTKDAGVLTVEGQSTIAVDRSQCNQCSGPMVKVDRPLVVTGGSMFRVNECKSVGSAGGLFASTSSVTINASSLFLMVSSSSERSTLFSFSHDSPFRVMDGSAATFSKLKGPASTTFSAVRVPTDVDTTSHSYARECYQGTTIVNTEVALADSGLRVDTIVGANGLESGMQNCAQEACVPANADKSVLASRNKACACICTQGSGAPFCSGVVDPMQYYDGRGSSFMCNVYACTKCTTDKDKCATCAAQYRLTADGQCTHV